MEISQKYLRNSLKYLGNSEISQNVQEIPKQFLEIPTNVLEILRINRRFQKKRKCKQNYDGENIRKRWWRLWFEILAVTSRQDIRFWTRNLMFRSKMSNSSVQRPQLRKKRLRKTYFLIRQSSFLFVFFLCMPASQACLASPLRRPLFFRWELNKSLSTKITKKVNNQQ